MEPSKKLSELMKDMNAEQLKNLAKVAESAERYSDMCQIMQKLVKVVVTREDATKRFLLIEERNLLSVAYKNVIGSKRSAWRTLTQPGNNIWDNLSEYQNAYVTQVEQELEAICNEVIKLLGPDLASKKDENGDESLLKCLAGTNEKDNDETEVFYLKMIGDYCRYVAEIGKEGTDAYEAAKKSTEQYYKKAMEKAEAALPETHPTRLGLALNYSVCLFEIMKEPSKACELAKKAFDSAIEKLDTLNDASYKDSTLIMQLLRDNLTLWTSENDANAEAPRDP